MLEKIAGKVVARWLDKGVIEEEDKEVYEYGMVLSLEYLASIVTTAFIALITKEIFTCMIFYICFANLRSYTGGFHAKTFVRCYLYSTGIILVSVLMIKFDMIVIMYYRVLGMMSFIYIVIMDPIVHENREVTEKEKKIFSRCKNKNVLVIVSAIVISAGFRFFKFEKSMESAMIAVVICCILARRKIR